MSLSSSHNLHQQIYATLGGYLRRDAETLHPDDSLRDDLGLDSLQTIELVYQVESTFDIQIPDEDFGRLQTIGDVITYLEERKGSTPNDSAPLNASTKIKKPNSQVPNNSKSENRSNIFPQQ